jgi:hypothetical protein
MTDLWMLKEEIKCRTNTLKSNNKKEQVKFKK